MKLPHFPHFSQVPGNLKVTQFFLSEKHAESYLIFSLSGNLKVIYFFYLRKPESYLILSLRKPESYIIFSLRIPETYLIFLSQET